MWWLRKNPNAAWQGDCLWLTTFECLKGSGCTGGGLIPEGPPPGQWSQPWAKRLNPQWLSHWICDNLCIFDWNIACYIGKVDVFVESSSAQVEAQTSSSLPVRFPTSLPKSPVRSPSRPKMDKQCIYIVKPCICPANEFARSIQLYPTHPRPPGRPQVVPRSPPKSPKSRVWIVQSVQCKLLGMYISYISESSQWAQYQKNMVTMWGHEIGWEIKGWVLLKLPRNIQLY